MLYFMWQYVYSSFLRYWLKWFIRQVTGKCELQRIFSGCQPGTTRTSRAEYSLRSSKNKVLRGALETSKDDLEQTVAHIMKEKNIIAQKEPQFKEILRVCLQQILGYSRLCDTVEDLRKEVYNSDNTEHEAMLLKLWKLLMPTVELESRVTKQWGDIGFQGEDPKTDFRGMGLLGLADLLFFCENYPAEARQVLSHANHPKLGYSYAIVGINLTEMAYSLLRNGALKPHFYNTVQGSPGLQHFHQLYCYLAYEFDKFWMAEEPESIMHFNQYREKFHNIVKTQLQDPDVSLTLTASSGN